jgi:hypothetical protein
MYNNIMNHVISSIILLSIVFIIIYILSIDNNIHKVKNKLQEFFTVFKSKKINYLNDKDNINLLNYIKYQFKNNDKYDNITIPSKIFYVKTDKGYELNDINIICYKYDNNNFKELPYTINILFVPFEKDNYFSNQTLFGLHGNYMMTIVNGETQSKEIFTPIQVQEKKVTFAEEDSVINTEVLDMIPDVIHLTESEENTTDTDIIINNNRI